MIMNTPEQKVETMYNPSDSEMTLLGQLNNYYTIGNRILEAPRDEFNGLSVRERAEVDREEWNTYQENDGMPLEGDQMYAWKSHAKRPIMRNRVHSLLTHMITRAIVPKSVAFNQDKEESVDIASISDDLLKYRQIKSDYEDLMIDFCNALLVDPVAAWYTEEATIYRAIRNPITGQVTMELNEEESGCKNEIVPVEDLLITNYYLRDIQKQEAVIWRRNITYAMAESKYSKKYDNFKYVIPGNGIIWSSQASAFVNNPLISLEENMVQEWLCWIPGEDRYAIVVNGILLTDCNTPNPRADKRIPISTSYCENILPTGKCFYGKSLVFKMGPDVRMINDIYPMLMDGLKMGIFPPIIVKGGEDVESDVMIPGAITNFQDRETDITPMNMSGNFFNGMNALMSIESSVNQSSQDPIMSGTMPKGEQTAYTVNRVESNAGVALGFYLRMISRAVVQIGKLYQGDMLQYMTLGDMNMMSKDLTASVTKRYLLPDQDSDEGVVSKVIEFDVAVDEKMGDKEMEALSFELLEKEIKNKKSVKIAKVSPEMFRKFKFDVYIKADFKNAVSEEMERAFNLELYREAKQNPLIDQEVATTDLLLGSYQKTKRDPKKFLKKQKPVEQQDAMPGKANEQDPREIMAAVGQSAGGMGLPQGSPMV